MKEYATTDGAALPAVGHPISAAQGYALEIINRTHKQWGVHIDTPDGGVDIDAVHRLRDKDKLSVANGEPK